MSRDPTSFIPTVIIISGFAVVIIAVIFVAVMVHRLANAFAKLGYIAREDAKKYFGDAADKVVDMNSTFYKQYQEMIDQSVRKVLSESGTVMAGSLAAAEKQAGTVILTAQEQARQIIESTRNESKEYYEQALAKSVDAMEWALEQYVKDHLDLRQHEEVVKKLLEGYVNERRN